VQRKAQDTPQLHGRVGGVAGVVSGRNDSGVSIVGGSVIGGGIVIGGDFVSGGGGGGGGDAGAAMALTVALAAASYVVWRCSDVGVVAVVGIGVIRHICQPLTSFAPLQTVPVDR
jgi:hypothetical protein